ncbi:hypothetical protein ACSS6W_002509 [Trichoderma asperelloides]
MQSSRASIIYQLLLTLRQMHVDAIRLLLEHWQGVDRPSSCQQPCFRTAEQANEAIV